MRKEQHVFFVLLLLLAPVFVFGQPPKEATKSVAGRSPTLQPYAQLKKETDPKILEEERVFSTLKMEDSNAAASAIKLISLGRPFIINLAGTLDTVPVLQPARRFKVKDNLATIFESKKGDVMAIFNEDRVYFYFKNRLTEEINIFKSQTKAAVFYKHNVLPRIMEAGRSLSEIPEINVQKDLYPATKFGSIGRKPDISKLSEESRSKLLNLYPAKRFGSIGRKPDISKLSEDDRSNLQKMTQIDPELLYENDFISHETAPLTNNRQSTDALSQTTSPANGANATRVQVNSNDLKIFYLRYYLDDANNDVWGFYAKQVELYKNYTSATFILSYSTLSDADKQNILTAPQGSTLSVDIAHSNFLIYLLGMRKDFWINYFINAGCVFTFLTSKITNGSDNLGIGKIEILSDGRKIRYFTARNNSATITSGHEMGHTFGLGHNGDTRLVALIPPFFIPIFHTDVMHERLYDAIYYMQNEFWKESDKDKVREVFASYVDTRAPTAPTNLTASNKAPTSVTLNWTAATDNINVEGYNVYKNGVLAATATGTSATITGLVAGTVDQFYVKAKDAYDNLSPASNTISVANYCAPSPMSTEFEYIDRVHFAPPPPSTPVPWPLPEINNGSSGGGANGYSDFTGLSQTIYIDKNQPYQLVIYPKWRNVKRAENYKVWIDYNQNGVFSDNEKVAFSSAPSLDDFFRATVTVPFSASAGPTRMRIVMSSGNGESTACVSSGWGEIEDYTININPTELQPPTAPTNLVASNITSTSLTLNWTASTDNVGVTGYFVFQNGRGINTVTGTSATVTGLTAGNTYEFFVRAIDALNNISEYSNTISVPIYCASSGQGSSGEIPFIQIKRVQLQPANATQNSVIDNSSTDLVQAAYSNYRHISATVSRGQAYRLTLTPSWTGVMPEYYSAWIDYNRNGLFENSELVVSAGPVNPTSTFSSTFTIPAIALAGSTGMRVALRYNAAPVSCGNYSYGDVEDYTLNISGSSARTAASIIAEADSLTATTDNIGINYSSEPNNGKPIVVYPNPAENQLYVSNIDKVQDIKVYNMTGQLVFTSKPISKLDVSALNSGVYIIKLALTDGTQQAVKLIKK